MTVGRHHGRVPECRSVSPYSVGSHLRDAISLTATSNVPIPARLRSRGVPTMRS